MTRHSAGAALAGRSLCRNTVFDFRDLRHLFEEPAEVSEFKQNPGP